MCITAGWGRVWEAAGSEPLFLVQKMGTQRSRPVQAEGLVEEGEEEEHQPLRPRAACAAPPWGPSPQSTAGRAVQELAVTSLVSSRHHLQHRPTLLLVLLREMPARRAAEGCGDTCCGNGRSQPFGGTAACHPKNTWRNSGVPS